MIAPVLCIIQARYNSTRLPGKMLLKLGTETLIERGHRIACEAFGRENVVVAIPAIDEGGPLGVELRRIGATIFAFYGEERNVLERFWVCAHQHRWHPDSVIVRYTPDDYRKEAGALRRVAAGERLPVQLGGEAFTLAMLDEADRKTPTDDDCREHITGALFWETHAPSAPADGYPWSIDTEDDYRRACEWVERPERRTAQLYTWGVSGQYYKKEIA